jgi:ABC-type multidrug transport system ATPase subunit
VDISLQNIGKKFRKNWVLKEINLEIKKGSRTVVLGPNGSGKSTLLQIISSMTLPTEGEISYHLNGKQLDADKVYKHISYTAPYLELLETLTLKESIDLHGKFKQWNKGLDTDKIIALLALNKQRDQQLTEFSSGMKQRLKLGLTLLTDVSLVLLDEPLTNLDENGKKWYADIIEEFGKEKTFVVCSNHQKDEYDFCEGMLTLQGS